MKESGQGQRLDPFEILIELKRRNIPQSRVAKRLNRSGAAISFALQGKSPKLLARIKRFLDRDTERRAA